MNVALFLPTILSVIVTVETAVGERSCSETVGASYDSASCDFNNGNCGWSFTSGWGRRNRAWCFRSCDGFVTSAVSPDKSTAVFSPWFGANVLYLYSIKFQYTISDTGCKIAVLYSTDEHTQELWSETKSGSRFSPNIKIPPADCRHRIVIAASGNACGQIGRDFLGRRIWVRGRVEVDNIVFHNDGPAPSSAPTPSTTTRPTTVTTTAGKTRLRESTTSTELNGGSDRSPVHLTMATVSMTPPANTGTSPDEAEAGSNIGLIVGIAAVATLVVVAGLGVLLVCRRRRTKDGGWTCIRGGACGKGDNALTSAARTEAVSNAAYTQYDDLMPVRVFGESSNGGAMEESHYDTAQDPCTDYYSLPSDVQLTMNSSRQHASYHKPLATSPSQPSSEQDHYNALSLGNSRNPAPDPGNTYNHLDEGAQAEDPGRRNNPADSATSGRGQYNKLSRGNAGIPVMGLADTYNHLGDASNVKVSGNGYQPGACEVDQYYVLDRNSPSSGRRGDRADGEYNHLNDQASSSRNLNSGATKVDKSGAMGNSEVSDLPDDDQYSVVNGENNNRSTRISHTSADAEYSHLDNEEICPANSRTSDTTPLASQQRKKDHHAYINVAGPKGDNRQNSGNDNAEYNALEFQSRISKSRAQDVDIYDHTT